MDILLWIVIVICFILGFVGIVLPILPSVALVWAGVAIFHFFIDPQVLGWFTWGTLLFFTALILVADQLSNILVVKRYGASKLSIFASVVGAFVGLFVFPPFGIVIVPFFLVLLLELLQSRSTNEALRSAFGTIVAFVGGIFAKGLIQLIMIAVFLIDVFVSR